MDFDCDGYFWRFASLWRRRYHAGDLNTECDGRINGRHAPLQSIRGADHHCDHRGPLPGAESRHCGHWQSVWASHVVVVRSAGRSGANADCSVPGSGGSNQPGACSGFLCAKWLAWIPDSWSSMSCYHRRRGAICRHGPLWYEAHTPRVVHSRTAGAAFELLRSRRLAAGEPGGRRESVLSPGALVGTLPDGGAGDGGGGDCFTSCNHGCVLARHAGRPIRVYSPSEDHTHFVERVWADLHSDDQLGADVWMYRDRGWVPDVEQPGGGLRNSGDLDDGDHDDPAVRGGARTLGMELADGGVAVSVLFSHRPIVLRSQHHQGGAWWMVSVAAGDRNFHGDDDVEEGAEDSVGEDPGGLATAGGVFTGDRETAAVKSAWDGNLHERECDADAAGIDSQPGTQQSAASAGAVSDGEDEAGAVCGWRASRNRTDWQWILPAASVLWVHGRPGDPASAGEHDSAGVQIRRG